MTPPKPTRALALLMLSVSALALSTVGSLSASLLQLDPLVPGTLRVRGISADGSMLLGASTTSGGVQGPTVWGLGMLPPETPTGVALSTYAGYATAITPDGSAVVMTITDLGGEAGVYRGNAGYSLLDSNGLSVGEQVGYDISNSGNRVVGWNELLAVYWDWNGAGYDPAIVLPTLPGATSSFAYAIDGLGNVIVGNSYDAGNVRRATYWSGAGFSSVTSLDPSGSYGASSALAISDDGSTIVGYVYAGGVDTATIWNGAGYGTTTLIGPAGATSSQAKAVNADGTIVGGTYEMSPAPGASRAFLYSGGQFGDLETLLTNAGVNLAGHTLNDLVGLSDDGHYMAVNDDINDTGYLVFYDGIIGGITSGSAQQASLTQVAEQRAALLTQPGAYESVLLGDLDAGTDDASVSAFGLYGSAAGGIKADVAFGDTTFQAGVLIANGDHGSIAYDGTLAAASLRQGFGSDSSVLRPFVEGGGGFGRLNALTFRRTYANGAGTATGVGTTDGYIASVFARLGVEASPSDTDAVTALAEISQHWLTTSAYAEVQSAANPFPGNFSASTDASTAVEVAADWTHRFDEHFDLSMRGAVGTTFNAVSNLEAGLTGAGTVSLNPLSGLYAEAGLRLGWQATETAKLDLYATGVTGERIGTAGHFGAGLSVGF